MRGVGRMTKPESFAMTRKVWRVRGAVPLVLAGVLGACGGDAEAVDAAPRATDGFTRVINVEVEPVATSDFTEVIRLTGTVLANRDVVVSAEEAGVITRILVDQGRSVWQGQPIARIDDRILISQVDQARAQAALAVETWERRKRLYEEDQVGSELSYLEAKYGAEQAQANLAALEQRLERTSIKAPFSGVLDSRNIELGSMVMPGSPVARIVDLDPVKIRGGVPERFALDVKRGSQATVSFQVLDDQIFEGDITYVGAAVDPRDRHVPGRAHAPESRRPHQAGDGSEHRGRAAAILRRDRGASGGLGPCRGRVRRFRRRGYRRRRGRRGGASQEGRARSDTAKSGRDRRRARGGRTPDRDRSAASGFRRPCSGGELTLGQELHATEDIDHSEG